MLKNYIKIALRNILKHKGYSAINILGLAGSTAVAILILFYVYQVFTFDQFHKDSDRIYFMYRDRATADGRLDVWDTWFPMLEAAQQDFPGIEGGTRVLFGGINNRVIYGENEFDEHIEMVDSSFLDVFSYQMIKGDRATALDDPLSVVLTQEMVTKYFGTEEPLGKALNIGGDEHVVTGVLGDIPPNTSFDVNFIVPLSGTFPWVQRSGWRGSFVYTFVKLDAHTDVAHLKPQLHQLIDKYASESEKGNVLLAPLAEFNDLFSERSSYAMILLIVAIGIILIAAINFTNLATAQSMLRAKEVGVRKVMGAGKSRLVIQFLSESMLMAFIALVFGGLLAELLMPLFSNLVDMPLTINYLSHPEYIGAIVSLWLIIGLLSGFYPAIYLSKQDPSYILKGMKEKGGSLALRNGLVVLQFSLAIMLMSGVGVILTQVEFMKEYNTNFDQDNVMVVPTSSAEFDNPDEGVSRILAFKEELKQLPGVENVSASNSVPGNYRSSYSLYLPSDKPNSPALDWQYVVVDDQYFQTYGIQLTEGNYFERTQAIAPDAPDRAILNQAAIDYLGWNTASDKSLIYPGSGNKVEIVGIVEDFNVEALRNAVRPVVHYVSGDSSQSYRYLSIKMTPNARKNVMAQVSLTWDKMNFGPSYEYYFPADRFKSLYAEEENIAMILTYAAGLAVLIACLGLFALASFTVMLRTKEMAIRKVLGASVATIVRKFSKHFAMLVIVAIVVAIPATSYLMGQWIEGFAYQSSINPMTFVTTGVLALTIALLSVGYHALRTGTSNPIDSLRDE
jgi:putative ABC transport system permease protein